VACGPAGGGAPGQVGQPRPGAQSGELTWIIADAHTQEIKDWFEQQLIPGFRKDRPKVQVTMLYASWGADFDTKRDTLYAAGTGPDIVQSGAVMVVMYALKKMAIPLDDRLKRWKDWADYYPVTQETMRFRDKQYGIPARVDARAMLYRQDLFQRQGLRLPETWDEMRTAALALTRRDGDQLVQLGYSPTTINNQRLFPIVWQNGGEVLSPDGRRPVFNSPEGVEALRYWADLLNAIAPPSVKLPPTPPTGASGLTVGTVAAELTGGRPLADAMSGAPEALPHIVVRPPLRQRRAVINVFNNWYGIGSQSKHPDLAWDLLAYFNQPEHLLTFARMHGAPVPRKSLRETGFMADPRFQMKVWTEVIEKYARPQPLVPNYADCWKAIDDAMADVRAGKQNPKQALDDAARQWQLLLDEGYKGS
jgi:multiple sugar transport system substrate-binding protein